MGVAVRLALVCSLAACASAAPREGQESSPVRMGGTAFRHAGEILAFEFSPDGKTVASIGADRSLRLWELPGGRELFTVRCDYPLFALGYAKGGSVLALAGLSSEIRFFDVPSGKEGTPVRTTERRIYSLAFAPKGGAWAAGGETAILLWEQGTDAAPEVLMAHRRGALLLAFSPDGRILASGGMEDYLCLWTLPKPAAPVELQGPRFVRIRTLTFSPDGASVAEGGSDFKIRVWKLENRSISATFEADRGIQSLAWSPDGKSLLAGVEGRSLFLWQLDSPNSPRKIDSGGSETQRVSFSPDGALLAAAGATGCLRFWTASDGAAVTGPGEGHRGAVTSITVLRPGGTIASAAADGSVILWDSSGRRQKGHEHRGSVRAIAISPSEGLLASAGSDDYIRLWHFESDRPPRPRGDPRGRG